MPAPREVAAIASVHARQPATGGTAPACFVTLRRPGAAPFYVSSPAAGPYACWGEYTSPPISPPADFAAWAWQGALAVVVGVYTGVDETWQCAWERTVDLARCPSVATTSAMAWAPAVYLGVAGHGSRTEYLAVFPEEEDDVQVHALKHTARGQATDPTSLTPSYTRANALTLAEAHARWHAARRASRELQTRTATALTDPKHLAGKVRRRSNQRRYLATRYALKETRQRVHAQKKALDHCTCVYLPVRDTLVANQARLDARRADLARHTRLLSNAQHARDEAQHEHAASASRLAAVRADLGAQKARLFGELETIYPVDLLNARDLLYSVVDLPLPNGVASTDPATGTLVHKSQLDVTASALALVAQVVVLASVYTQTPLPYTLRILGSRATVQDRISVMHGARTFPLYGTSVEPFRYEYGVFLLNKDLEQLMNAHGVPVLDLRHTLPNLFNLLTTLATRPPHENT